MVVATPECIFRFSLFAVYLGRASEAASFRALIVLDGDALRGVRRVGYEGRVNAAAVALTDYTKIFGLVRGGGALFRERKSSSSSSSLLCQTPKLSRPSFAILFVTLSCESLFLSFRSSYGKSAYKSSILVCLYNKI